MVVAKARTAAVTSLVGRVQRKKRHAAVYGVRHHREGRVAFREMRLAVFAEGLAVHPVMRLRTVPVVLRRSSFRTAPDSRRKCPLAPHRRRGLRVVQPVPRRHQSGTQQCNRPARHRRIFRPRVRNRIVAVGNIRVKSENGSGLFQVAHATRGPRPRPRLVQRRQQHGGQNRDDRNFIYLRKQFFYVNLCQRWIEEGLMTPLGIMYNNICKR